MPRHVSRRNDKCIGVKYATSGSEVNIFPMTNFERKQERWAPETSDERNLVLLELDAMLSSHHFRGSRRYPALLKYVVTKTLDGHSEQLKERTLGVEVFERAPDYDTNADPVVRFSAGEIRKRIALFYHENEGRSQVRIELPLGSYIPEFKPRPKAEQPGTGIHAEEHRKAETLGLKNAQSKRYAAWVTGGLILAIGLVAAYARHKSHAPTVTDKFWSEELQSSGPVLIVVGAGRHDLPIPEPPQTSLLDHMLGPYQHVSWADAIALSRVSGVLKSHDKTYEIKEDNEASLNDLRSRSVIFIGAKNNIWTMRLLKSLRFRFLPGPMAEIQDTNHPDAAEWVTDFSKPFASIPSDYAIVARYHDQTTNGNVIVVAGLAAYGTEAASEFVASPDYLGQILSKAPAGWEKKNLEMVIRTDLIHGEAGPPHIVGLSVW
jgi:hypothetical protein